MRKLVVLLILSLLVLTMFSMGCVKEDNGRKLASRPVRAVPLDGVVEPSAEPDDIDMDYEGYVSVEEEEEWPEPVAGEAFCEQLSISDISGILGGLWTKESDCPDHPAMPEGVSVCMCAYDGPKHVYVTVETQLYSDADEAERVYNMYCSGTAEESEVGTYSCRVPKTTSTRPNFVYFLSGNHFVKVSCLGGTCPLDSVAELAKKVDANL